MQRGRRFEPGDFDVDVGIPIGHALMEPANESAARGLFY
jgi:hypothetical protein